MSKLIKDTEIYSKTFTTSNRYIDYRIVVTLKKTSIENNNYTVNIKVDAWRTNQGYTTNGPGTVTVEFNSKQYSESITRSQNITYNSHTILFDKDFDISANNEGKLTLKISASISHSQFTGAKQSDNFEFPQIPRASIPTLNVNEANLGENVVITSNRSSESFTHKVYYSIGDLNNILISDNVKNSYTWNIPKNIANQMPNTEEGTLTLKLVTYQEQKNMGEKTITLKVKVPSTDEFQPKISKIEYAESDNDFPVEFFVKDNSKIKVKITSSGAYGSQITNYNSKINNEIFNTNEFITNYISSNKLTLNVSVKDSRGRMATKTLEIENIEPYIPPLVKEIISHKEDDKLKIDVKFSVCELKKKNKGRITLYYKKLSDINYSNKFIDFENLFDSTKTFTITVQDETYDIYIIINDLFSGYQTSPELIKNSNDLISFNENNKVFAIGKKSEIADAIENTNRFINYDDVIVGSNKTDIGDKKPGVAIGKDGRVDICSDLPILSFSSPKLTDVAQLLALTNSFAFVKSQSLDLSDAAIFQLLQSESIDNGLIEVDLKNKTLNFSSAGTKYGLSFFVSDERFKENIKECNDRYLEKILDIKHIEFNFKKEYGGASQKIGYSANQLQEISKDFVQEIGKEKTLQPNIAVLMPAITKSIQELNDKVISLETKMKKLEGELNK